MCRVKIHNCRWLLLPAPLSWPFLGISRGKLIVGSLFKRLPRCGLGGELSTRAEIKLLDRHKSVPEVLSGLDGVVGCHSRTKQATSKQITNCGRRLRRQTFVYHRCDSFLGKAVIEKLLWSTTDIDKIFVLIRPQKDTSCAARLENMFDRLRKKRGLECTSFLQNKLQAISGDVTLPILGLGPNDQQLLQENVDITIHSAATVQFNEPLDVAVKMNCVGAVNIFEFVKACPHLLCHLRVSTAYVSSSLHEPQVREELVLLAFNPEDAVKAVLSSSDNQLKQLQDSLMGNYFNTYVITKSMAEHLIKTAYFHIY